MITIQIGPQETDPHNGEKLLEQEQNPKRKITRYIVGIALLLAVIIISLTTGCSFTETGPTYQYQIPEQLGDGWVTASLEEAGLNAEPLVAMMEDIQDGGFENERRPSPIICRSGKHFPPQTKSVIVTFSEHDIRD